MRVGAVIFTVIPRQWTQVKLWVCLSVRYRGLEHLEAWGGILKIFITIKLDYVAIYVSSEI